MKSDLFIGIMTGTSMDAIDLVICRFNDSPEVIHEYSFEINTSLRKILFDLATIKEVNVDLLVESHFLLAQEYAKAVNKALIESKIETKQIRAIGLHGQTIRHLPKSGATFQLGSGPAVAARTEIDVISDFRSADIALGGQGAPLMPMFDYHFLKSDEVNRICLNIGGIGNITFLPAKAQEEDVIAFDTGPGNMIIDALMLAFFGKPFDEGGAIAKSGNINEKFLSELLSDQYFIQTPPKSTGRELFGEIYVSKFKTVVNKNTLSKEDALATATELTARTIAASLEFLPKQTLESYLTEIIASGGGVKNDFLCQRIKELLPNVKFRTSDEAGIPSQAKEALAFAWFAKAFLENEVIHLPGTTGASRKSILGSLSKGS
jgi:anhydro-N-acetylmuramic acid kinase